VKLFFSVRWRCAIDGISADAVHGITIPPSAAALRAAASVHRAGNRRGMRI